MTVMQTPNSVLRLSRQARRAIVIRNAQNAAGRAMVWAMGAVLLVVLLDRLVPGFLPAAWWILPLVGALLASGWALSRSVVLAPNPTRSAGLLDDRLHLRSRLRSAIELAGDRGADTDGFVELALRDADTLAVSLDAHAARPPAETRSWWWSGMLLLAVVAAGLWVPARSPSPQPPRIEPPTRALAGIDSTDEIAEELAQDESTPESVREELSELEALREELSQGVTDQQEAEARTAAKLEELAEAMERESQEARDEANAISESIEAARNNARAREEQWDPRIDEFAELMRQQRFDEAADQIESLNQQLPEMSPEERERIADQLEELANAVEPEPTQTPEEQPEPSQPQSQPDTPAEPESAESPDAPESPESSEAPESPESQPEPRRELSESLREQAERVRDPDLRDTPPSQDPRRNEPQPQPDQRDPQDQNRDQSQEKDQEQDQEQDQSQDPDPTEQRQQEQGGQQQQQQEQREQGQSEPQQGERQSESPQQGQDQQQQSRPAQDEEGQPREMPRQDQSGQQGDPSRQQQPQPQQDRQDESLAERLRRLEEQQRRARRDQERAERLREQAERLTRPADQPQDQPQPDQPGQPAPMPDQQDPQQRGGAGDGDPDAQPQPPNPTEQDSDFVPVDARDEGAGSGGEPVGKWYAPEGEALEPGRSDATAQRFRRASEQAQRAIDEQQVPRRYRHLVREAFERVKQRADTIDGGGKIAPQGQDAVPSKSGESSGGGS